MPVVAIPIIAILVVALMSIILLQGAEQFGKAVSALMPSFHIPGLGSLRNWVASHVSSAVGSITSYLDSYVHPLSVFVSSHLSVFKAYLSILSDLALDTHTVLYSFATHTIPMAISNAKRYAVGLVNVAEAKALSLYHSSLAYAHDLVNYALSVALIRIAFVEAMALTHYRQALTYAHDLSNYVLHAALTEVANLDAKAVGLYHLSLTYAHDLAAAVESNAVSLYHSALNTVENRYQQALAFASAIAKAESTAVVNGLNSALITDIEKSWPLVVAGIGDVIDVAGVDFPDVTADLRNIARSLPKDLPAAIAASTAIAIPLLRLARDCTMPNCRNLSQIGRDLQALFNIVESGAIIALLAEAANDPAKLAGLVRSTIGPLVDAATLAMKSEVGIN